MINSINFQRTITHYRRLIENNEDTNLLLSDIKSMVKASSDSPIQNDALNLEPVRIVAPVVEKVKIILFIKFN